MEEQRVIQDATDDGGGEQITLQSSRFGEFTLPVSRLLSFPRGVVGFPDARQFVFLHTDDGDGPFFWMQSVENPDLAFIVCEPRSFFPEYEVPLTTGERSLLEIEREDDGLVCVILVVPEDPSAITANLRGPLVINSRRRLGFQLVLSGDEFPVKASLFPATAGEEVSCSS